jgi:hypothetical protein
MTWVLPVANHKSQITNSLLVTCHTSLFYAFSFAFEVAEVYIFARHIAVIACRADRKEKII